MATLRIEFDRIGGGRGLRGGQLAIGEPHLLGAATLAVTETPTAPGAQPSVPASASQVYGRLIALDAACYVDAGPSPNPAAGSPILVVPGRPVTIRLAAGDKLSAVLAGDLPGLVQKVALANGLALTQSVVSVTATSAAVLGARADRRYLALINTGAGRVSLGFGAAATVGAGWPLSPAGSPGDQGGSFFMEGAAISTQAIHAVAASPTTLVILEG